MDQSKALAAFAALSQDTRLAAFRVLVQAGPHGLAAGALSERLGVPQNTLSFHLGQLTQAGLVVQRKTGRQRYYSAEFPFVRDLIRFMVENCCSVDFVECAAGACNLPDVVTFKTPDEADR